MAMILCKLGRSRPPSNQPGTLSCEIKSDVLDDAQAEDFLGLFEMKDDHHQVFEECIDLSPDVNGAEFIVVGLEGC